MAVTWPPRSGAAGELATAQAPAGVQAGQYRGVDRLALEGWSKKRLKEKDSATVQAIAGRANAIRVVLRPGDYVSEGWRAELADPYHAPIGPDLWYGFSTYIPKDYPVDEDNICVLAQWHDQANPGKPAGKPMLAHRYNKGVFYVSHDGAGIKQMVLYEDPKFARGAWHNFVYHIRWSETPDGYIEGWIDGRRVIDFRGTTMYPGQKLGPYFKFGVYCAHDVKVPHVAYHADYSRGGSYAQVDPEKSGGLVAPDPR